MPASTAFFVDCRHAMPGDSSVCDAAIAIHSSAHQKDTPPMLPCVRRYFYEANTAQWRGCCHDALRGSRCWPMRADDVPLTRILKGSTSAAHSDPVRVPVAECEESGPDDARKCDGGDTVCLRPLASVYERGTAGFLVGHVADISPKCVRIGNVGEQTNVFWL